MGIKIGIAGPLEHENYREAVFLAAKRCGIDLTVEISLIPEQADGWDGLILPGGGDTHADFLPGQPAQEPTCTGVNMALDKKQFAILDRFVKAKKPVFGICRGMQLIGVYFGSDFYQNLPTAQSHRYIEYDQIHSSHAVSGSFLEKLYGETFSINSAHHQGVKVPDAQTGTVSPLIAACEGARGSAAASGETAQDAGPIFCMDVIQRAQDGVIEGIVHKTLPVIGLQWHPERLCGRHARPDAVDGGKVFEYFLKACCSRQNG